MWREQTTFRAQKQAPAPARNPFARDVSGPSSVAGLLQRVDRHGERRWNRARQIISELEGTTRGPYAGCVGNFSFNGNLDTCITIRTALLKDGKACVQAGGGWVNDSEPEAEFQETVNKSKAMLKAVALAETFSKSPEQPRTTIRGANVS